MQSISKIHGRYYLAIFVLASATLSYQILITRFFSVMLYYHFAFAAISLAMLGLTRGAMEVYGKPARYAAERVGVEFARHASWFALSSVGAMVGLLCLPTLVSAAAVPVVLAVAIIAFIWPFTEGGVCITLLLTRLPYSGGWLYAADLLGAAVGCLGVIFLLLVIDPVSATLWIAALAAGVGWIVIRNSDEVRSLRLSGAVALTMAAAATVHTGLDLTGKSHLGVFWAKGEEQAGTLFERWNTYSRVRVREWAGKKPVGWGYARQSEVRVDQHYIDIDADAGTVITRFDGDIGKLSYLKDDVINAAYLVQPVADVAVVGVGGGRDILSGLVFGAKQIRGIEINPAIFEVLTEKFADFAGHLERQPGVSLVNAEARSYINHSSERYDLVQISLIDTWAATAAGGLTLTENRLYTVEAWDDFYRALKPGGLLSVSRWYDGDKHRGEFYRLVAIAASALQRKGVPAAELRHHVVALNVGNIVTVITRPDAFSDAQWQEAREKAPGAGIQDIPGAGHRLRCHHLDVAVRQGGRGILRFAAGEHRSIDGRQTVLLLHFPPRRSDEYVSVGSDEQQCRGQHDRLAHHRRAPGLRILHRSALPRSCEADAVIDADAADGLFQRDRDGFHADRDIANAAPDGLPRPSRLRVERGAVYDFPLQRHRQCHSRRGCPSAARHRLEGYGSPDHDRGSRAANAAGHRLDAVATNRHAHSGLGPAAGAPRVLHGDDVSARPQYLAPS